jgi:hypothetical protein
MADIVEMTDEQFESHALRVLGKELGPDGLARFIRLNRSGSGDYTRDRHQWLDKVSLEDILKELQMSA